MAMDWYSWLSQSNLEADLVYEYYLLFSSNELERDDIHHFDHEFLQSMGISIAKHRLEILKLAKKQKSRWPLPMTTPTSSSSSLLKMPPVSRLLAAVRKSNKCLAKCIASMFHHEKSAIVVVPPRPTMIYNVGGSSSRKGGLQSKETMLKRKKNKEGQLKQARLMLTKIGDGSPYNSSPAAVYRKSNVRGGGAAAAVDDFKSWDSMFQDMKPT